MFIKIEINVNSYILHIVITEDVKHNLTERSQCSMMKKKKQKVARVSANATNAEIYVQKT